MLLGFIGGIGPVEMIIVGIIAVLLFGKRLPEVGRSLGRGITEFKKGIRDVQEEVEEVRDGVTQPYVPPPTVARDDDRPVHDGYDEEIAPAVPKFEPPPAPEVVTTDAQKEPQQEMVAAAATSKTAKPARKRAAKAAKEPAPKKAAKKRASRKKVDQETA